MDTIIPDLPSLRLPQVPTARKVQPRETREHALQLRWHLAQGRLALIACHSALASRLGAHCDTSWHTHV